jgi:hypothetical protein
VRVSSNSSNITAGKNILPCPLLVRGSLRLVVSLKEAAYGREFLAVSILGKLNQHLSYLRCGI